MARSLARPWTSTAYTAMVGALLACNCTLALRREHDQCVTSLDCQALAAGAVCTDQGICEKLEAKRTCLRDADCDPSSLCRASVCQSLVLNDCRAIGGDGSAVQEERLPIAVLVPRAELANRPASGMLGAALTAIDEINGAGAPEGAVPRVVAVACPDDDMTAIGNLADLGVRIMVGPLRTGTVRPISDVVAGRAALFSPFASGPDFELPLKSRVISCTPNNIDVYRVVESALGTFRERLIDSKRIAARSSVVMALSTNEINLGFSGTFTPTELGAVQAVHYDAADRTGLLRALVAQKLTPRLIAAASAEDDWTPNIDTIEGASDQTLPYYFLNGKQGDVLALASDSGGPIPRLYERVFGLDRHLEPANARVAEAFQLAFGVETNNAVSLGLSGVYDCTYLAVYAALAAQRRFAQLTNELSADAIAVGLRAVTDANAGATPVGKAAFAAAVEQLDETRGADATFMLRGASGDLAFSLPSADDTINEAASNYDSPQPSALEIYCVDAAAKAFCDTGLLFFVGGTSAAPAHGECACSPYAK